MARNYMHDIVPTDDDSDAPPPVPSRSIRSLRPSAERVRLSPQRPQPRFEDEERPHAPRRSRLGIWIAAGVGVAVMLAIIIVIIYPSTMITVVPRTHILPFDASTPFTAYPAGASATGTIAYTVTSQVIEDSAVVEASGTEKVEEKATGSVTLYNEYSDQPVRLIKNTRFETPAGLIFRIPASVDVPARKGTTPGTLTVTIFADQTGPSYNIPPTGKFTIPGLKSTPDMYAKVYAKSTTAFTGGFSGDRPAVSPSVLEAAKAEVRSRLDQKAREVGKSAPEGSLAFAGLFVVTYETLPPTNEPGGGVRIHERATISMPIFDRRAFAQSLALAVAADAEGQSIGITFSDSIGGVVLGALSAADLGREPITFTLTGKGLLTWNVDAPSIKTALAGREEEAFEPIIQGFPAVEAARARITPFWKHSFPVDVEDISITIQPPVITL